MEKAKEVGRVVSDDSQETRQQLTPRFWVLDLVRVPALLAVIGFHSLLATRSQNLASDGSLEHVLWFQYAGSFGVSIFFFLSGFGTHYGVMRKGGGGGNWSRFLVRRVSKL
ncbi:MAG: acyltransferase family protein [Armatimonadetes bacterium]|nr:acyltransferase family protein [Akkermansiaceae bacterium]